VSGAQVTLAAVEAAEDVELVDAELVSSAGAVASASALSPSPPPIPPALAERNLFAEAERIAARAASASTRRQYAAIFRAFGDWLAGELGRPPVVGDLDVDVVAAYGRHLATCGGRGGGPAAPATVRVYLSMVRALVRDLGLEETAEDVRVPRHEPGPPETFTDTDYANLLRGPRPAYGRGQARLRARARARGLRAALGRTPQPCVPAICRAIVEVADSMAWPRRHEIRFRSPRRLRRRDRKRVTKE